MAPKSKSIFRQPGAQHFQLVHRSQRDPLIHDPDASKHVLKPVERENTKKGKSRADLESLLSLEKEEDAKFGEAALYGVYYDDTEYDYMQHLRPVGVQEDGVESVLLEAPSTSRQPKTSKQASSSSGIILRDLPPEALASTSEMPREVVYESQQAIPESLARFQPDMDPHLRQVLEALEDDAFVDDELEDDFFGELVADGERSTTDGFGFEFHEDGEPPDEPDYEGDDAEAGEDAEEPSWESRFAQFKKPSGSAAADATTELDFRSEGGDTIGRLPEMSVIGGKRRRKGTSDASGYSMSSSSMYRTEALQTLDERFDRVMLKEYAEDDEDEDTPSFPEDDESNPDSDSSAPELITTREDFTSMMDDFLSNYEVVGRRMKPVLEGDTPLDKLETIRRALGSQEESNRERVLIKRDGEDEEAGILMPFKIEDKKDRWDCETILSTYSNLENHPHLIRARDTSLVPKIRLDPRTGLPSVVQQDAAKSKSKSAQGKMVLAEPISEETDEDDLPQRVTVARPRDETAEEKKARKQAVKADRALRRVEKKGNKEQFSTELKNQMKGIKNKEATKLRKL